MNPSKQHGHTTVKASRNMAILVEQIQAVLIEREGGDFEHVAGPGCVCGQGYSGHRILLEKMKGCRALQCLVLKEEN
jgi:streptomycin 6-kinase